MSKKSITIREKKRKLTVNKYSDLRAELKNKIRDEISFEGKLIYYTKLQKLPRDSSRTRLHNRCFITGRPRGYYRHFGLSRHILRDMAHYGLLPGITKSSW
uniref:Small ribosomal subunit protein uS14c n=1 Tax=Euglena clara TaxID=215708 RepID=A0A2Z4YVI5_9EUGL|nr:ribosomal protein S14 [Euglena clara]AXA45491.1 ribosomal protein S14 [Euglena clara]